MHKFHPTKDIKLAACLDSLGIPFRPSDPVTREVQERNGRPFDQFTFWFDVAQPEHRDLLAALVDAYYAARPMFDWMSETRRALTKKPYNGPEGWFKLGEEHPLYYIMDALWKREDWLFWMHNKAEPMKCVQNGNRVVMMSARASQATKDKIKSQL